MENGLTVLEFWQVAAAVFMGNVGFFAFGYYLWQAQKNRNRGRDDADLPLITILLGIAPPLLVALAQWYMY